MLFIPATLLFASVVILLWLDASDKALRVLVERAGKTYDPRGNSLAKRATWFAIALILSFMIAPRSLFEPAPPMVATYTAETNAAFAAGLAKSRTRLLQDLELLLTGNSNNLLEELQDVLLQADLGTKTADDIVQETKSVMSVASQQPQVHGIFDPATWTVTYVVYEKEGAPCAMAPSTRSCSSGATPATRPPW